MKEKFGESGKKERRKKKVEARRKVKYSKFIWSVNFLNKLRRNTALIKSRFVKVDNRERKKLGERRKKERRKERGKREEKKNRYVCFRMCKIQFHTFTYIRLYNNSFMTLSVMASSSTIFLYHPYNSFLIVDFEIISLINLDIASTHTVSISVTVI